MLICLVFDSESDRVKFEYIYSKYKKLLLYKAYEILNDHSLAEDAASEAFIRIYKNLHKVGESDSNMSVSFYVTIVKNVALTILEKQKMNSTELYDDIADYDCGFDMEGQIISEISSDKIYTIIDSLDDKLKSVFLFVFAHGLSHKEIAHIMGITENYVGVLLKRSRNKIADILKKEGVHAGR